MMTHGGVHLIIKHVFDNAIDHLQSTGEAHRRAAERLRQASAHWLRHTAGSHMMDGQVDLRYARGNLRHESISTTSQYLHADDDDRHRAMEAGLRRHWWQDDYRFKVCISRSVTGIRRAAASSRP
jgi:integrase/recombinase XerD